MLFPCPDEKKVQKLPCPICAALWTSDHHQNSVLFGPGPGPALPGLAPARPAGPSRAEPEPSRAETSRDEPSQARSRRAEPSRAGPSRAEPSRAKPSRAGPSRARGEPNRADSCRKVPNRAETSRAGGHPRAIFFKNNSFYNELCVSIPSSKTSVFTMDLTTLL